MNLDKRWYIAAGVLLLVVLIGVTLLAHKNTPAKQTSSDTYYDSGSGQTVSSPAGKAPDVYGTGDQPIYLGISNLLNYGVSGYQLNALKSALAQYSKSAKLSTKEYSINVSSISKTPHDPDSPTDHDVITFNITLDRTKTFKASLNYFSITSIDLTLSNANTDTQIFDSGTVDLTSTSTSD